MPTLKLIGRTFASRGFPRRGRRLGDSVVWSDDLSDGNDAAIPGGHHSGWCVLVREPDI
jgi:hypothetical protein